MTLAIHPLLLFWKSLASITRINNVRSENFIFEFSGMVAVQLSMFLFAVSLRQLVYYISLAVACQQLFYFSFSRISVVFRQPEQFTIIFLVCQQLFEILFCCLGDNSYNLS